MEVMRDVVLHGRGRPEIPSNWLIHQVSDTAITAEIMSSLQVIKLLEYKL